MVLECSKLGTPACALQLKITEREVAKGSPDMRELLAKLHGMGVKLAMDDFGTGASSLGFVRWHPFDSINFDKSFVTNLCRAPWVLGERLAESQMHNSRFEFAKPKPLPVGYILVDRKRKNRARRPVFASFLAEGAGFEPAGGY